MRYVFLERKLDEVFDLITIGALHKKYGTENNLDEVYKIIKMLKELHGDNWNEILIKEVYGDNK